VYLGKLGHDDCRPQPLPVVGAEEGLEGLKEGDGVVGLRFYTPEVGQC